MSLTKKGLWSVKVGEYGATVRVREESIGGRIVLDHRDSENVRRLPYATSVQSVRNTRGGVDPKAAKAATEEGRAFASRLHLQKLRQIAEPTRLTLSQAWSAFFDPKTGGLPGSDKAQTAMKQSREFWMSEVGENTPWNRITPAIVEAAAFRVASKGQVPSADKRVKNLRTLYRWLVNKARVKGLEDPTLGFPFKKLWEGYEPRQPRYSVRELRQLLAVAHEVDPRFRFMLIWAGDSGARSAALFRAMRSQVDEYLDIPPTPKQAPYGWANLPAMKGQRRALTFLTLRQRLEFVRATTKRWNGVRWVPGYLSALEARYQAEKIDYPLIPGGVIPRDGIIKRTDAPQVSNGTIWNWLHEAEEKAGIARVEQRGWHGIRRAWSDLIYEETDLDTLTDAGAWSNRDTPANLYLSKNRMGRLARSREAIERKDEIV